MLLWSLKILWIFVGLLNSPSWVIPHINHAPFLFIAAECDPALILTISDNPGTLFECKDYIRIFMIFISITF